MRRALTDNQVAVAARLVAALGDAVSDDAFAAMASIMAATINDQARSEAEALARAEMWGQRFLDLLIEGRKSAFAVASGPQVFDARYVL